MLKILSRIICVVCALLFIQACVTDSKFNNGSEPKNGEFSTSHKTASALDTSLPRFVDCRGNVIKTEADDFRLSATGDIVFSENEQVNEEAFTAFRPFLKSSDLVLGNLEGAITTSNKPLKPYVPGRSYAFRFPPSAAGVLRAANFHVISIANNHSQDYGTKGFSDTLEYLSASGVQSTGLQGSYVIRKVKGLRVGVIALAHYPMFNNVLDIEATARLVASVRGQSEVVVLFYQLGAEGDGAAMIGTEDEFFLGEKRGNPRAFATAMVQAGASALIGHGPHVLRASECIQGVPVLHSIGNFVSSGGLSIQNLSNVSAFPELVFDRAGRFKAGRILPVTFAPSLVPQIDPSGRGVWLANWLSKQAQGSIPSLSPLLFNGYEDQSEAFAQWFSTTRFGMPQRAAKLGKRG